MAIEFTSEVRGDLLLVQSSGRDESLEDVQMYGLAVYQAVVENGCTRVLVDETELEYLLDAAYLYELAEFAAQQAPNLVKIALICTPAQISDATLWGIVTLNRGLQTGVFTTTEEAEAWVMKG
jgi:GAF domain-containing protein